MLRKDHEPPAFTIERADSESALFLTCDHASARIPEALGELGVSAAERARHIAWDIGALAVARLLSARFNATLIHTGYSRLVIDCNRHCERADLVPEISEYTEVPGNRGLCDEARRLRIEALWQPYHAAIAGTLAARAARGLPTLFVSMHSFTPVYKGEARPWQIAMLSNRDRRVAEVLLCELGNEPGLCVGDNIPYRLTDEGDYGVPVHAERVGLPHVLVEIRQNEIDTEAGQQAYAERLARTLPIAARAVGLTL